MRLHSRPQGELYLVVPVHDENVHREVEVQLYQFSAAKLDGGQRSDPRPGHFTPNKNMAAYPENKLGRQHSWFGHFGKDENPLILPAIELQ